MRGWSLGLMKGEGVALGDVGFGVLELEGSTRRLGSECSWFGLLIAGVLSVPGLILEGCWMECSRGIGPKFWVECSVDGEKGLGCWRTSCCCQEWGRLGGALVFDRKAAAGRGKCWRRRVVGREH